MADPKNPATVPTDSPGVKATAVAGISTPKSISIVKTEVEKERDEVFSKMQKALLEYNGQESNIPIYHEYWELKNRFRFLAQGGK